MRGRKKIRDTFCIQVLEGGIVYITDNSEIPDDELMMLFEFAFNYGRIILWHRITPIDLERFAIAFKEDETWTPSTSSEWLLNSLNRFEEGWNLVGTIAFSPIPSNLENEQVIQTILDAVTIPV